MSKDSSPRGRMIFIWLKVNVPILFKGQLFLFVLSKTFHPPFLFQPWLCWLQIVTRDFKHRTEKKEHDWHFCSLFLEWVESLSSLRIWVSPCPWSRWLWVLWAYSRWSTQEWAGPSWQHSSPGPWWEGRHHTARAMLRPGEGHLVRQNRPLLNDHTATTYTDQRTQIVT